MTNPISLQDAGPNIDVLAAAQQWLMIYPCQSFMIERLIPEDSVTA